MTCEPEYNISHLRTSGSALLWTAAGTVYPGHPITTVRTVGSNVPVKAIGNLLVNGKLANL
jgi:hypothetical protein